MRSSVEVGKVTFISPDKENIHIGTTHVGLRDIKPKPTLNIGDRIKVTFPGNNWYYAKTLEVLKSLEQLEEEMKQAKSDEILALINESKPVFGQEVLNNMSDDEKETLKELMTNSVSNAIKVYHITATYEDTKKDLDDIAGKVVDLAVKIAVVIDTNSTQILKKHVEETKEKEAKAEKADKAK